MALERTEEHSGKSGPELRKLYYSIGEVSQKTGIPAHVLRYWESEFSQLRPKKGRSGNRSYQSKDIELVERIKTLLYEQKYTIPGARAQLKTMEKLEGESSEILEEVRRELNEILEIFSKTSGRGAAR